ncbi:hypothetical protein ABW20_dc0110641 [Dactylellina cionopaga]|nr:hypothetical protein ABW20_dc0110641 [Dactylellina cionopaga]
MALVQKEGLSDAFKGLKPEQPLNKGDMKLATRWTGGLSFALMFCATIVYTRTIWNVWGDIDQMDDMQRMKLYANGLQAFGGLLSTTYAAIQHWKQWNSVAGSVADIGKHIIEIELPLISNVSESVVRNAASLELSLSTDALNKAGRLRSNSGSISEIAKGISKSTSMKEAMLAETSEQARIVKAAETTEESVSRLQKFNTKEGYIRAFCLGVSLILLVLAAMEFYRSFDNMDRVEVTLTTMILITQFVAIIADIATFLSYIPSWFGIAIAATGFALDKILSVYTYFKYAIDTVVSAGWFEDKGTPLLGKLDPAPSLSFVWEKIGKLNGPKVHIGGLRQVWITGTQSMVDKDLLATRLLGIKIIFTCGNREPEAIFHSKQGFRIKQNGEPDDGDWVDIHTADQLDV